MSWLTEVSRVLQPYYPVLFLLGLILCLVLVVLFLVERRRTVELLSRLRSLVRGMEGTNLEEALGRLGEEVTNATTKSQELEGHLGNLDRRAQRFIQGMALERYNALQDASGDLSFSWALLDALGNGAVLTGLYGRTEYRLYAKPLRNGSSYYPLTGEEKRAIEKAEEQISGKKTSP
ncbi:MAG: DUF4446 family protein [Coprothermobacterota bacterium]|nr:DUF4446 family protein [Coprothermobacterota bacterium]